MFIDTHMHEMTCSKDSFLKLEQMVEIAKAVSYNSKVLAQSASQTMMIWD